MLSRARLTPTQLSSHLALLEGWTLQGDGDDLRIAKHFSFTNYYETMAFVNALAFVAHQQDHHPEMRVSYKSCLVQWHTHDAGGLTALDLDSAARTDRLLAQDG
jgi:4a-hydroxytetrahydrobiopterin dehydratase